MFRYALERWKPDPYKGIFIYKDEISQKDQALLEQLKQVSSNPDAPLNLLFREVDVSTYPEEKLKELLQGPIPDTLPVLAIWYPDQMGKKAPIWTSKLTPSFLESLVQSPKRKEMAESLIKGESVVWVFIPSGNTKKDERAKALVQQELGIAVETYSKMPFSILAGNKQKKLSYGFPILTLSREDPAERAFVDMLLKSESDLYQHTEEPMVFPVFGRGRVLGCLFGEYITAKNIQEASAFLAGACSCEVKELNPGIDLLVSAPWDMVVMNSFVEDTPLPELTGVLPEETGVRAITPENTGVEESAASAPVDQEDGAKESMGILKVSGIALSSILVVVVFAGFILSHRHKKNS